MARAVLPAPYEGIDLSVPAHLLPPTRSQQVQNWLPFGDKLVLRGPAIYNSNSITGGGAVGWAGVFADADQNILIAHAVTPSFALIGVNPPTDSLVDRWFPHRAFDAAHPRTQVTNNPRFGYATYQYSAGGGTNYSKVINPPHGYIGLEGAAFKGTYWGHTINPDGVATYILWAGSGYHPITSLFGCIIDELTGTLTTQDYTAVGPMNRYSLPRAFHGIANYANRLWVGGGIAPSTTADTFVGGGGAGPVTVNNKVLTPNTLFFTNADTDPFAPRAAGNGTAWFNPAAPTVANNLVVGREDSTDHIVALAATNKYMLIMKKNSTWVLTGSGLDSFTIRPVSLTVGVDDPRAWCVVEDVVYMATRDGLKMYDGAGLTHLSTRVDARIIQALEKRGDPNAVAGSVISLNALNDNFLLLRVGEQQMKTTGSGGAFSNDFNHLLYHIPTGRWVEFVSYRASSIMANVVRMGHGPMVAGEQSAGAGPSTMIDLTYMTNPFRAPLRGLRGSDPECNPSFSPINDKLTFPADCYFPPIRFASPFQRSSMRRYGVEVIWEEAEGGVTTGRLKMDALRYASPGSTDTEAGYTEGQVIAGPDNIPPNTSAIGISGDNPLYYPIEQSVDSYHEATDLVIRISRNNTGLADTVSALRHGEVQGAFVDYEAGPIRT